MKKNEGLMEKLRFLLTGGVCFLVEFFCLVLLRDTVGLDTLMAVRIAFLISVLLNYLLCVKWVFGGAKDQSRAAKLGFLVTSVMGLVLNDLLMRLFKAAFGEDAIVLTVFGFSVAMYMVNKVLATMIVLVWNYFTKRAILKKGLFQRKTGKHEQ